VASVRGAECYYDQGVGRQAPSLPAPPNGIAHVQLSRHSGGPFLRIRPGRSALEPYELRTAGASTCPQPLLGSCRALARRRWTTRRKYSARAAAEEPLCSPWPRQRSCRSASRSRTRALGQEVAQLLEAGPKESVSRAQRRSGSRDHHATATITAIARRNPGRPLRRTDPLDPETCRNQDRAMHPYLVDAHNARLTGQPIPTPLAAA
jgi:hypothetical protein